MGADPYPKVPISGASSYTAEPQDLPLQSSIPPTAPSATGSDQSSSRGQYTYMPSSGAQLSSGTAALSGPDSALSIPRYVDVRPTKSPRHAGQQSVHNASSVSNGDAPSEYRYGSYRSMNSGSSEVAQSSYPSDSAASSAPSRDYYPPSSAWTSTAGEHSSTVAYASHDGRPYSFPHEPYKPTTAATSSGVKQERSFDTMNHYSWSAN